MFKFKNADRQGAEFLKKYGYVEFGQFQPTVLHDAKVGQIKGYFCANCKYLKEQEGTLYNSVCTNQKIQNGEVASWGCCNLWEYAPPAAKGAEAPEADSTAEPAEPAEPTGTEEPDLANAETPEKEIPSAPEAPSPKAAPVATGGKQSAPTTPAEPKPKAAPAAPVAPPAEKPEPPGPDSEEPEEPENVKKLRERIQMVVRQEISEILSGKRYK